jgi:hypothetical protein
MFIEEWWSTLSNAEHIFWIIAIVFTVFFVIQFVLSIIGMDLDADTDIDIDTDTEASYDVDPSFTLFSVRSIIAFFTFFGWTGVLTLNAGVSVPIAVISSVISGGVAMTLVAVMLFQFIRMTESGTIDIRKAISSIGEVYLTVPASEKGKGKIHLKVDGKLMELDAITKGSDIKNGENVRVVEILKDNLMLVETVEK